MLTNKNSKDAHAIDHKNILAGLYMKKFAQNAPRKRDMSICMQLIKPESKQHYLSSLNNPNSNDQIIIVEEIKMNLLAKSCFSPGIISFISNLITSSSDEDIPHADDLWMQEYLEGMDHEIYRVKLSTKLENKYFRDIVKIIYKQQRAIVFAIEVQCNQKTIIRLNPSDFIINNIEDNDIWVYCICPEQRQADAIEVLDLSKDDKIKYWNSKATK